MKIAVINGSPKGKYSIPHNSKNVKLYKIKKRPLLEDTYMLIQ